MSYFLIFALLIFLFSTAMIMVSAINITPSSHDNYYNAGFRLQKEGIYPAFFKVQFDNYTDALMINITMFTSYGNPIKSAFGGYYYDLDEYSKPEDLFEAVRNKVVTPNQIYPRYWHGYVLLLKPLFHLYNYDEIRHLNSVAFYLLFLFSTILLFLKTDWKLMISYVLSILLADFFILPLSLQFSNVFFILFISIIVLLYLKNPNTKTFKIYCFVLGCITMFFDFYTYPYLTLVYPLIVIIYLLIRENHSVKEIINISLSCMGLWLVGYLATWLAGNAISTVLYGDVVIRNLLSSVNNRLPISDGAGNVFAMGYSAIKNCFSLYLKSEYTLFLWAIPFIFMLYLVCSVILRNSLRNNCSNIKYIIPMLLPVLFTLIWLFAAGKTLIQHDWFQYRGICGVFFGAFYMCLYIVDFKKLQLNKYLHKKTR